LLQKRDTCRFQILPGQATSQIISVCRDVQGILLSLHVAFKRELIGKTIR
jgi:hypothetical protein